MKKLLFLTLLMSSLKVFSQEAMPSKDEDTESVNIYEEVEKMPEYPGGINGFRKDFAQAFKADKVKGKGSVKSEVRFVVSQAGIITDIIATGDNMSMNKEMERSVKSISVTHWKPAEINGYPVRYRFRLPITMNFE